MKMFSWLSGLQKKTDMRQRWNRPGKHRARPGRRQNAEALESRIVLAAPTLSAISDVTFFSGSAFHIPLNAEDTDGDSLMFTALSADPALSTDVLTGNRSLRIAVEQGDPMSPTISGEMTFELFEDEASRATNRIITLAESGFYDASTFHRVIDNFVIQGGDPNGVPSGTGGSMLGDFDDQFDFDLQHNRTGMLSYAKSSDDTNDSQFFVTEYADPTVVNTNLRNLDSNHSVFGVQTTGEAIRAAISDTSTGVSDVPDVDVVLTSVTVFLDTQNGVLRINAPEGTTGSTTVTVTVSDGSETDQQTFNVSFTPDTANNNPFLADIPSIRTLAETPTTFQLTALDVETGGTTAAFLDQVELSNRALFVPLTANPAEVSYNTVFETGLTTVTPATSFVGTTAVSVSTGEFTSALDYQVVDIEVVGAAEPLTVSAAEHPGLTEANDGEADEIRLVRNGSKFEIFVNGQVTAQAEDVSVTTLTIDGSRDDDTLIIDYSGGNPFPAGGIVFNGYTVDPGEQSPPADTGIDSLEFTGGAVATATYTFTNATDGSVNLDGGVLTYVGLEPIKDNLSVTDRVFTYSSVADVITTGDDGVAANGLSRIATGGTGETVDFTTPSGSLTINAGDGADSVTVGNLDSGPFAVTVNGGSGNDTVNGSSQGDLLNGDAGNDVIIGSLGDDSLNGGDGDDGLFGGGGADILGGGAGDDTVRGQAGGGDRVTGGGGADFLDGGSGADVIEESLTDATVTMTDTSLVGSETDVLAGIESAEIQFDGSSNSFDGSAVTFPMTVHGGGGNDTLFGGSAADELDGGDADDFLLGFGGNDTMTGGDGNDRLFGSAGIDIIDGGSGDDEVRGQGSSGDRMTGGAGDDTLNGGAGTDIIVESNDSDFVLSPGVLTGHGTDVLISVEQADLTGGAGNNTLDARTFTSAALSVSLRGAEGDDTLLAGSGPDGLFGDQGNDVMQGFDGNDDMYGGAGSDTVDGGAGNDFVRGQGASSDVVTGGVGDDTIDGGSGTDFLLETADVESLIITNTVMVGNGTDVIRGIERLDITGGAGNNMIDPRAFTPAGVNVIRGLGGDDQLFGTSERDVILGGAGDDTISGRDAADSIIGDAGNDSIEGGEGADVLNGNDGDDVINGDGGADFIQGEGGRDTLSGGLDADTLSGGTEDDSLDGGDGDDVLNGNAGDDVVNGDAGADSIDGEAGSDTLTGGLDEDTLRGGADDDNLDGGAGDDGLSGASGADFLLGNSGNDSIYGGSGNDTALGSGGQDSVIGGSGDDLVRGNGASDVLVGGSGTGSADAGDVFPDAITGEIDENFTLVPLPGWVEEV